MVTKETGGPAFASGAIIKARARPHDQGSELIVTARKEPVHPGMTLRDYFAAKAMQGAVASTSDALDFGPEDGAAWAYRVADAMLEARAK